MVSLLFFRTTAKHTPKVYSFDHHRVPLVMFDTGDLLKQVLNIPMPPVSAFDCRYGRNVWLVSICRCWKDEKGALTASTESMGMSCE